MIFRGFGYIEFTNERAVRGAIEGLNDFDLISVSNTENNKYLHGFA